MKYNISNLPKPKSWRTGQTIFNFLEWLSVTKGLTPCNQQRMVDPFYFSDKELDELYNEFLNKHEV